MDELRRYRRTSVSQSFQTRQVIFLQVLELSKHIEHGRHYYRVRYLLAFNDLAKRLRTEFRNRSLTSAERRRGKHEGKIRDVKHGRGMKIDTLFSVTHPVVDVVHVRHDIGVCQRHALRQAGCSTGVNQGKNRVRIVYRLEKCVVLKLKGLLVDDS